MEGYKHFSHRHNLNHYQVPRSTLITCSGCNKTATGTIYACWKCNYFLHENCYLAPRSLQHQSHPSHPLTLVQSPTYPSSSFFCNICTLTGTGFSYCCSHCEFDLHIQCAIPHYPMPSQFQTPTESSGSSKIKNDGRGEILHKSHSSHPLTLIIRPPNQYNEFTCHACKGYGLSSTYHCATCNFSLHDHCASLYEIVKREDHRHPLQLIIWSPVQSKEHDFECDVCHSCVPKICWFYYCKKCDFGCHPKCVNSKACSPEERAERLEAAKIRAEWDPVNRLKKFGLGNSS